MASQSIVRCGLSTPNRPNTSRPNQSNNSIVPTNAARGHMLYPMLDIAIKYSFQAIEGIKRVESSVTQLKGEMKGMQNAINELRDLIKSQKKSTFSLKEEGYEIPLRCSVAGAFCQSLTRDITDEQLSAIIKNVLKQDVQFHYKTDVAKKFCKRMLSVFKTEERRRILGISPCQQQRYWPTERLAQNIMGFMKAPATKADIYTKHLAMLRKYIRQIPNAHEKKQFYDGFKKWIEGEYAGNIQWEEVLEADVQYDYSNSQDSCTTSANTEDNYDTSGMSPTMETDEYTTMGSIDNEQLMD